MAWLSRPADLFIRPNEVHVWRVALERPEDESAHLIATLSRDERERAASLIVEAVRRRWTMARGLLRVILGRYIGVPPHAVRFRYGERGKPTIDGPRNVDRGDLRDRSDRGTTLTPTLSQGEREEIALTPTLSRPKGRPEREVDVRFNLAHSGELALIAVSQGREIGVDVEAIRPNRELERIAERFFSTREVATLLSLPPTERTDAFYRCWTRKEAYLKAIGAGLSVPLDSFDVAFAPAVPAELLATRGAPNEAGRWSMIALDPGPCYAAALVVEGSGWNLQLFEE